MAAGFTLEGGFFQKVGHDLMSKLRQFWLIAGIGGTGIAAFAMGSQVIASFTHLPAVATVTEGVWTCEHPHTGRMVRCTEADVARLRRDDSELDRQFIVAFRFTDQQGQRHDISGYITKTGLARDDVAPGVTFDILYDPSNPKSTSLPPGTDYHAFVAGSIGLAALASYAFFFWLGGFRRR